MCVVKWKTYTALVATMTVAWAHYTVSEETQPHAELIPEEIVGIALYPDGETPVSKLPVRVWDVEKKQFTHRSRTAEDGTFRVPKMKPGRSYLFVGGVKIDVRILAKSGIGPQQHDIVVALPRRMLVARQPKLYDLLLAPLLIQPPDPPQVVSP